MSDSTQIPEEYQPDPTGITAYTLGTANGFKVSVALELLGLKFKAIRMDTSTNIQKAPWFVENFNLNGRLPVLVDNSGAEPVVICETGAILTYLAVRYDKEHKFSYPIDTKEYYETVQWVFFQTAGVGPMCGQAFHFKFASSKAEETMGAAGKAYGLDRYTTEARRLFSVLEQQILHNGTGWIVGPHVSIADICNLSWVMVGCKIGIDVPKEFPKLAEWVYRMLEFREVRKGLTIPVKFSDFLKDSWKWEEVE